MQTGNPFKIEVVLILGYRSLKGAQSTERRLHEDYERYRVKGEWFSFSWRQVGYIVNAYSELIVENNIAQITNNTKEVTLKLYLKKDSCFGDYDHAKITRIDEDGKQIASPEKIYFYTEKMVHYYKTLEK